MNTPNSSLKLLKFLKDKKEDREDSIRTITITEELPENEDESKSNFFHPINKKNHFKFNKNLLKKN
jgi:hypothetical protein